MRAAHWLLVLRLATLLALGVSAALLVDYTQMSPTFCGEGTGCAQVRGSGFGYLPIPGIGTLPLPALGLLGFGLLLAVSLVRDAALRARLVLPLALALGVSGVVLFALQVFVIGHVCAYCVVVDLCAIAIAGAAVALRGAGFEESTREEITESLFIDPSDMMAESQRLRGVWREDSRIYTPPNPVATIAAKMPLWLRPLGWGGLGVVVVAAPLLWPTMRPGVPVPDSIREYYVEGKLNVVEFADFECPHCRDLHARLEPMLREHGDRVNFVRLNMPLSTHPHARLAAEASVCAETMGKGEPMADALFEMEPLSRKGILSRAKALGLDLDEFQKCLTSEATKKRLDADREALMAAGFEGLPTTYIQGTRLLGAQPDEEFRDALDRAASGEGAGGIPGWLYTLFWVFIATLLVAFARVARKGSSPNAARG